MLLVKLLALSLNSTQYSTPLYIHCQHYLYSIYRITSVISIVHITFIRLF